MPFKKFSPIGLTLVAVSSCSHGDRQNTQDLGKVDSIQYRSSSVELAKDFDLEKRRFSQDLSQRLSELDARIREIQVPLQVTQLSSQRRQLQNRLEQIIPTGRFEWPQLKAELQERYDVLSANVDKYYFQSQATGEN